MSDIEKKTTLCECSICSEIKNADDAMRFLKHFDQTYLPNGDVVYNLDGANKMGEKIHYVFNMSGVKSYIYINHHDCSLILTKSTIV